MAAMEIRPLPARPELKLEGLDGASISVDEAQSQFTWTGDKPSSRRKGPRTVALADMRAVVRAGVTMGDASFGGARLERLLFIGTNGRCLWTSRLYLPGALGEVWPLASLARLETVGVVVREESFPTARAMQRAYPGSAARSQWASPQFVLVPGLILALLIAAVVLIVVAS